MQSFIEDPYNINLRNMIQRHLYHKNKQAIIRQGANGETMYCCIECPMSYDDKEKLEHHLCMHNNEYRFLCGICGTGLKRREHLERHLAEHNEVRPHMCTDCGKAFKRKEHLTIHQTIHNNSKKEVCPICLRSFHRKDHLQKHMAIHSKDFLQHDLFPLTDDDAFSQIQKLQEMAFSENILQNKVTPIEPILRSADPLRPYGCSICSKTYKRRDHLKLHSYTHLKKEKICMDCGKAFHKDNQLASHMHLYHMEREQHNTSDEDVPSLQIVDAASNSMNIHQRAPRQSSDAHTKPHACPICDKRFKRRHHLREHTDTHFKTQNITCSFCNGNFTNEMDFESHMCQPPNAENIPENDGIIKIENNDEMIHMVDILEQNLMIPMEWQEPPVPTPEKVFLCKECGKTFRRKDHYKIHLNVHTGIKTVFCPDCGKGFYRKDHLRKHMLVHDKVTKKVTKPLPDLKPITASAITNIFAPSSSTAAIKGYKPIAKPTKFAQPMLGKFLPEITIHAPSNMKLRVPLQIKVPYQVVTKNGDGSKKSVTIHPSHHT